MLEQFEKLIVVAGCQRSGTTLTGQILGAHPNAFLIDEPDGLYPWFDAYVSGDGEAQRLWNKLIVAADEKYQPDHRRLRGGADGERPFSAAVRYAVLKAPNLTYDFKALAGFDIPVTIVFPVRDPRPVVASMAVLDSIPMVEKQVRLIRARPDIHALFAGEVAMLEDPLVPKHVKRTIFWRIKSTMYRRFLEQGLPTFMFRYEDMVADKAAYCRKIAEHAGIAEHYYLTHHEEVYVGFGPGNTRRSRPVDLRSMEKWKSQLTHEQEADIIATAGSAFHEFGYDEPPKNNAIRVLAQWVRGLVGTR
ncbi:MAG: sulfotransferase [Hyphomicrobiales bacterium]|nr:sulfotransferase [Nitratireductor sp.]MCC2098855.1 sulfotransferase [Hyphomicrobiales bacterium]